MKALINYIVLNEIKFIDLIVKEGKYEKNQSNNIITNFSTNSILDTINGKNGLERLLGIENDVSTINSTINSAYNSIFIDTPISNLNNTFIIINSII